MGVSARGRTNFSIDRLLKLQATLDLTDLDDHAVLEGFAVGGRERRAGGDVFGVLGGLAAGCRGGNSGDVNNSGSLRRVQVGRGCKGGEQQWW